MTSHTTRIALMGHGVALTRMVQALRELELTDGRVLRTVAVLDAERRGSWLDREAEEVISLPPGTALFDVDAVDAYLAAADIDVLVASSGREVPWLRYAERAEARGWTFVGPSAATLRRLLDPLEVRRIAEGAGVATVPWSGESVESLERARAHAERIGYPVLCRSSGSAHVGLGLARTESELPEVHRRAVKAAARTGSSVLLERFLPNMRRFEVPVISATGGRWALDVIDASMRRRDGSVLIEAPAPGLRPETTEHLRGLAVKLADAFGHEQVGTMIFSFDPTSERVTFLGYDFCCGGEHAAVEMLRGIDLAKVQLQLALGETDHVAPPEARGSAVVAHVKVRADGSEPLVLEHFTATTGPGTRTDAAAASGDRLLSGTSVAELVAWGANRVEALSRLRRGLRESALLVRGGETSLPVIHRVIRESAPWLGPVDTDWLQDRLRSGPFRGESRAAVALVEAAIEGYELDHAADRQAFHASAKRGRPQAPSAGPRTVELEYEGHRYVARVAALDDDRYAVAFEEGAIEASVVHRREHDHHLIIGATRYHVVTAQSGFTHRIQVDGEPHRVFREASGIVRSAVPAVVAAVHVREGDSVSVGDRLAVLEAMKTEMSLVAPFAGRVRRVTARANLQVAPGEPLVWLEPADQPSRRGDARVPSDRRVDLGPLLDAAPALAPLSVFESLVRGYDVEPEAVRVALRELGYPSSSRPDELTRETGILQQFIALLELEPAATELTDSADGGLRLSHRELLRSYLMDLGSEGEGLPAGFVARLEAGLAAYGVTSLHLTPRLLEALCRIHTALGRRAEIQAVVVSLLARRAAPTSARVDSGNVVYRRLLDRIIGRTQAELPDVCDAARSARYRVFDGPFLEKIRVERHAEVDAAIERLVEGEDETALRQIVQSPQSLSQRLLHPERAHSLARRRVILDAMARRYYRVRALSEAEVSLLDGQPVFVARYPDDDQVRTLVAWLGPLTELARARAAIVRRVASADGPVALDIYGWEVESTEAIVPPAARLEALDLPPSVDRVVFVIGLGDESYAGTAPSRTFRATGEGFREDELLRGLHPMVAERLEIGRLANFELTRIGASADVHVFSGVGKGQPGDRRVFVYGEVRDLTTARDDAGHVVAVPQLERIVAEALASLRSVRMAQSPRERNEGNRLELFVWPTLAMSNDELMRMVQKLAPSTVGLGLEQVRVNARLANGTTGEDRKLLKLWNPSGRGVEIEIEAPDPDPVPLWSPYRQKVMKLRQRGLTHPHELIRMLTPDGAKATRDLPAGEFIEHDMDEQGRLHPVERGPGENVANVIVGLMKTWTEKYPEGMTRVALFGDPSRAMGSLAEPECRRINAALDWAEELGVPVEWYAVSAGAEISKDRGTENMDWIAAVLRRIIQFTQSGHELNVVVCNINVGAQPYWNAEATMLMHTKGVLIMVADAAMVLTGKQALDYSGGVSADDNLGIGGYERIMGPNGQAQYFAPDLVEAGKLLLRYYEHTYRAPGERYPRSRATRDDRDRDVCASPHGQIEGSSFETVGEIFSRDTNPGRKQPFDIRRVMGAVVDVDSDPLERWRDMRDAETVVTWDAHLGGHPIALLGIESRPIRRLGFVPADGPRLWTGGTLFPQSSKKAARAINAASGNRPLVILANLTGFDGSPESLRMCQLEFGAEIGRAVVNFEGPIVFTVVSRFHGGAFVVFSNRLNDRMETFALEGTYASVIGGAPAAAVVFARELKSRVERDPRVTDLTARLEAASGAAKALLSVELREVRETVHSEHLGRLATEYDGIHDIERARSVGSVHQIVPPQRLRLDLIEAIERGMARDGRP
jgi:acetyl/propionyl-CoA carboxylase alpha subunit/acetyl-CoA carboxylase carboxyltransferase component